MFVILAALSIPINHELVTPDPSRPVHPPTLASGGVLHGGGGEHDHQEVDQFEHEQSLQPTPIRCQLF